MSRRRMTWVVLAVVAVGVVAAGYWFAPWKLFTTTTVDEALSVPVASAAPASASVSASASVPAAAPGPVVLSQGAFVTHEHETTGTVRIVRLPDGTRTLELVGLSTSDGPDLRVWLSDQPVREGKAGWVAFGDGNHLELGRLKGNRGNQAYPIPAEADLGRYRSVSIWCIRFSVSFGAAALA